ncbi:MAG TPA: MSMEG_4193 family putative phosphomutase [Actinomycetota bacterium]
MPLLLLIRHALTEATGRSLTGWTPGVHLSEQGRGQARALAERLVPVRIAAIYSSPLERCLETAEPVAAQKRLSVTRVDDLGEVRYGDWTGRTLAQLSRTRLWRTVQSAPSNARFPNGESLLEVQERAAREVGRIAATHPRGVVAAFSHGDVIRLLLAHYSGVHVDLFQRLVISPASVTAVALGDGVPRIVRVNDTGAVADLIPSKPRSRKMGT